MPCKAIFCLLSLLMFTTLASAQIISVEDVQLLYPISNNASFFKDDSGLLTIQDVQQKHFEKISVDNKDFGMSDATFWIRFEVHNQTKESLRLIKEVSIFNFIGLYQAIGPDSFRIDIINESKAFNSKNIRHPVDQFDLNVAPGQSSVYFLQLKSPEFVKNSFFIATKHHAQDFGHQEDILIACFLSIFFVMFFYNLFIYLQTRDRGYLYYDIYILLMALAQLSDRGYSDMYLWPEITFLKQIDIILFSALTLSSAVIFVRNFLKTKILIPRHDVVLKTIAFIASLPVFFSLFGAFKSAYVLINIIVPLSSIYILILSIKIVRMGFKPARFFLLGWITILLAAVVISLFNIGLLPNNFFIKNGFILGSIIEIVLISWALGDKINNYKRNRDKAIYEKEMLLLEQNEKLEKLVVIRTDELHKNLKIIQQQNLEKEVLLKEIHHRVKNNLQIISSLLSIQNKNNKDTKVQENIISSQRRINSIAVIHEMLYNSDNIAQINFGTYVHKLSSNLINSLKKPDQEIQLDIQSKGIQLNLETSIPLGLIINEILTNSLKYAFTNTKEGTIYIHIKANKHNKYTLLIGDNGQGIPTDFNISASKSLGTKLIRSLSYQLSGTTTLDNNKKGTNYIINFEKVLN